MTKTKKSGKKKTDRERLEETFHEYFMNCKRFIRSDYGGTHTYNRHGIDLDPLEIKKIVAALLDDIKTKHNDKIDELRHLIQSIVDIETPIIDSNVEKLIPYADQIIELILEINSIINIELSRGVVENYLLSIGIKCEFIDRLVELVNDHVSGSRDRAGDRLILLTRYFRSIIDSKNKRLQAEVTTSPHINVLLNWLELDELELPSDGTHVLELVGGEYCGTKIRLNFVVVGGNENGRKLTHGFTLIPADYQTRAKLSMYHSLLKFGFVNRDQQSYVINQNSIDTLTGARYRAQIYTCYKNGKFKRIDLDSVKMITLP